VSSGAPRGYGLSTGVYLVVASMVGAGILTSSGYTLRETGNPWSLLGLWALGGIMALAGAMTVAEMASMLPHVGGDYLFARQAFGRGAGVVVGWATFVLGFAAPTAVIARLASSYLLGGLAGDWQPFAEPAMAVFLIGSCAAAHSLGRGESAGAQAWTTVAKLSILSALVIIGFASGNGDWGHFRRGGWPSGGEWPVLAGSLVYVGYAYAGWNAAAYLAGELKDPPRMVPRALVGGCLLVTLLYLALNSLYIYAVDPASFATLPMEDVGRVAELAMTSLLGPGVGRGVSLVLGIGLVASVSAYLMAGSRVLAAMAADGAFFPFAGRWHAKRGTPAGAVTCLGMTASVLACSGSFLQLLDYTSTGLTAVSAIVVAAIFPLRARLPASAFRTPLFPVPPLLVLGLSGWTIAAVIMQPDKRVPALLSLGTIALGIPLVGWRARGRHNG